MSAGMFTPNSLPTRQSGPAGIEHPGQQLSGQPDPAHQAGFKIVRPVVVGYFDQGLSSKGRHVDEDGDAAEQTDQEMHPPGVAEVRRKARHVPGRFKLILSRQA